MPSAHFEELAYSPTPMGDISLRRRFDPIVGRELLEVILGDEYLMSSAFTVAEIALADLGLRALADRDELDVVVGGLGLGYTAVAALSDPRVRSLLVVEALDEIIDWHREGLVPGPLATEPRARLVQGDFFAMTAARAGYDPAQPERRFDAILVDIDHSPRHVLNPSHASFYSVQGVGCLAGHLNPDGVFGLWSDDPPDDDFVRLLSGVFADVVVQVVPFPNPYTGGESANTVYIASNS